MDARCGTCLSYTADRQSSYGICRPIKWLNGVGLPWWAKRPQLGAQTGVRPDEGKNCPGWSERAVSS